MQIYGIYHFRHCFIRFYVFLEVLDVLRCFGGSEMPKKQNFYFLLYFIRHLQFFKQIENVNVM